MNKRDIFILIGLGFVSNVLVAATRASIPDFLMLSLISFGGAMMGGGITALLRGSSFESSVMVDIVEELMEKFKKELAEICKKERMTISVSDPYAGRKTLLIARTTSDPLSFRPLVSVDLTPSMVQVDYRLKDTKTFDPRITADLDLEITLIKEYLSPNPTAA